MNDRMTEMRRNDDSPLRELQRARRSGKPPRGAGHGNAFTSTSAHPDDMIVRAVSLAVEDLVARLVAAREAERDAHAAQAVPRRLCFSGWVLDAVARRLVAPGGGVVLLPALELALLQAFVDHPRQVLSRADLTRLTRSDGSVYPSARTISVYVSRLRRHLRHGGSASLISTVRRMGYVLDADVERR